jgi:uncharacterized protein (TIGR03437 family)
MANHYNGDRHMRFSGLILAIGLIPLAALPAVAGSVSFSLNMTGVYEIVPVNNGGSILATAELQPLAGTIAPFGQAQATFTSGATPTMTVTLGNGMTIAASVVATVGASPFQPTTLNGTITGGIGVFQGASGTFTAALTPVQAGAGPTSIPVVLTGSGTLTAPNAPSGLNVLPSVLRFDIANGSISPASQSLVLDNEGLSAEAFQVTVSTASGGNWLSASSGSGSVAAAQTFTIAVTADPAPGKTALKPGIYEGLVTVTYETVSVSIKTHLIIGGLGANLLLSETGLTFQGGEGGYPSHSFSIQVENVGVGDLTGLTAKTSVTGPGANWLHAAITPVPGNPQVSTAAISVSPLPAVAGTYYGRVDFSLTGAANSPQSVPVVLQIIPGPIPDITPSGVAFGTEYIFGQPTIPALSQDVKLFNLGTRAVTFSLTGGSRGYSQSGASMDWLTVSPNTGSIGPGSNAIFTVSVPPGCFGAGDPCQLSYFTHGGIYVTFLEDSFTTNIPVELTWPNIWAGLGLGSVKEPAIRMVPAAAAGCAPSQVNGVFTSLLAGFQATVGLPVPVEVQILDSCAKTMDTGTVVATFSNGDPPLTLTGAGGGQWTGTWTPRTFAAQTTVTVKAIGTNAVMGMLQLAGSVAANTATPIVGVGGVVNAASYAPTVAPGALISIYGSNFAGATNMAPSVPWPTLLGNTQVLLGGRPMPLYFVSNQQIDAVVPYDVAPNSLQQVIVQNGTAYSQPETMTVAAAQPGVFSQDQSGTGPGAILGQKPGGIPALNTAANPASVGDALLIFCTGLGTVSPPVSAGAAASTSALSYTDSPVTVTVGGKDAQVLFAGLAPGWVALYQVNVLVPPGVATGPSVPVVVTAAGAAGTPVTVAIQ